MRTKFKDASEVIAYQRETVEAIVEADLLYQKASNAHQASSQVLADASTKYRIAREEGANAEALVARLTLPDDMREPSPPDEIKLGRMGIYKGDVIEWKGRLVEVVGLDQGRDSLIKLRFQGVNYNHIPGWVKRDSMKLLPD